MGFPSHFFKFSGFPVSLGPYLRPSELSVLKDCAAASLLPLPLGISWPAISSEALVLPGIEKVECPLVTTWWAGALCRDRRPLQGQAGQLPLCYTSSLELPVVKGGAAWQLSSHLILPIHTHIEHFLNGPVQWTDTCLLPVVESAQLWALGIWDLELRAIWPVTHLSLSCNWCLLSRICLFF